MAIQGMSGIPAATFVVDNGFIVYLEIYTNYYSFRPAINLKPGIKITGDGIGTKEKPYVIE